MKRINYKCALVVLIYEVLVISALALALVACTTPPTTTPTPTQSPIPTPSSPLPTPQADAGALLVVETETLEKEKNTMSDLTLLLTAAAFLSLVANRLVEGLVTPLFDKYEWDKFLLMYVAWAVGCGLVIGSGINLFTDIPGVTMPHVLGLILSGLVAGGGSNLLHELFGTLGQSKGAK